MTARLTIYRTGVALCSILLASLAVEVARTQQTPPQFGGAYSGLDSRRQQLVSNWVARFSKTTGQKLEAGPFYDEILSFSSKTTFDAVTHALMASRLTDASGAAIGDALALVEYVEALRGEVAGASGDRQFRMYVRLNADALDKLEQSREFKRGVDNAIYHKGYPINYREQGGTPSIQISVAPDRRRADIDVDYRSSSFPSALFNGHLSAANSDVRAGDNSERHSARWAGLQNWWRGFFGVRLDRAPDAADKGGLGAAIDKSPRAGKKDIDVMVNDFLNAWLVEGDVIAAMTYVSHRAYACLAQDADDPSAVDRGMAPFQLMQNLKAAHEAVGKHTSLEGLTVGVRLTQPALRVLRQPHHAQFVIYSVPDDIAADFDCETRLTPGTAKKVTRAYGSHVGATFFINGRKDHRVSLLWARENGYWKIVSWRAGDDDAGVPMPAAPPDLKVVRVKGDPSLVEAARSFLETWLIRKDYDAAFQVLSAKSYDCYNLERGPDQPVSTSSEDAGRRIRAGLERTGQTVGTAPRLDEVLAAAEPFHPSMRLMDHAYSRTFTLTSLPNALGDVAECAARARGAATPDPLPLDYGEAFGMIVRFQTQGGEAPVLRLLWRKEAGAWRITSYGIELP